MYSEDIEAIARFVQKTEADIIFLQELTDGLHMTHPDTGSYIADVLGYDSHIAYGPMVLPDGASAQVGMGIFSKFPLSDKQKIILQQDTWQDEKITSDERFYLQASVMHGGQTIGLGTTHLPFHPTFRTTSAKKQMVERIFGHSTEYSEYIFGADLNTTPHTQAAKMLRQRGLVNAGPALRHPTWTTKPFAIGPWTYAELQWRLDYILIKGNLQSKSSRVLETELSDHLPIVAEIEVEN
jgi:endonuclease/exonuclease/phosphatase family metal-dependent hydrolase